MSVVTHSVLEAAYVNGLFDRLSSLLSGVSVSVFPPQVTDPNTNYVWINSMDEESFPYYSDISSLSVDINISSTQIAAVYNIAHIIESEIDRQQLDLTDILDKLEENEEIININTVKIGRVVFTDLIEGGPIRYRYVLSVKGRITVEKESGEEE